MIYRLRIVSETMQSGQSSLYNLVAYRTVAPRVESPPPPPPPPAPVVVVVSENLDVPMEIVASHTNVREVQTQTGAIVCACCDVI